jgi:CheY-specific phosphatase CheX
MDSNKDLIDEMVTASTLELFASMGIDLESAAEVDRPGEFVAVIGFSGESVRGAVGLALRGDLVANALRRSGADAAVRGACDDFVAELANQLLGRVKNKMLRYGTELALALPMVLRGIELRLVGAGGENVWAYCFSSTDGGVSVWFDARFDQSFQLELQDNPELEGAPEGEMMMF